MGYTEDIECTSISGEDLDILYGLPSIRIQAFLDWFQSCLSPSHSLRRALSAADYKFYKRQMKEHGETWIIDGEELMREEMICAHEDREDQGLALEAFNSKNNMLEKQISALETTISTVLARNTRLERCVENESNLIANLQSHHENITQQSLSVTSTDGSLQAQQLCGIIEDQIEQYVTMLRPSPPSEDHKSYESPINPQEQPQSINKASIQTEYIPSLIHQLPLQKLLSLEAIKMESLMRQLRSMQVTSRNASDQTQQTSPMDTEKFPKWLLEVDPAELFEQEHHVAVYNQCSIELARLETAMAVSKEDQFRAQIELLTNKAYLEELSTHSYRKMQLKLLDPQKVNHRIQSAEAHVQDARDKIAQLITELIPKRCREVSTLKCSSVVLETYRHRMHRQQNRLQEFDSILSSYEKQHDRLDLLQCVLTAENNDLQAFHTSLKEIFVELDHCCQCIQDRLTVASITQTPDEQMPSNSEHAPFLQNFRQVLEGNVYGFEENSSQQIERSKSFMVEELFRLSKIQQTNATSLAQSWTRTLDEWQRLTTIKQDIYQMLRTELYGDSHSWTPQLLAHHTHNALQRATEAIEVLEKTFSNVTRHYESEKRKKEFRNGEDHDKLIKLQGQLELLDSRKE
ncbi:unnamed protein product [Albugo candida]|nr:unnamed protein product [Albugo candida]|eukprot:CCI44918.1 unnamed protein product [Albugo candida]